ncbi:patatin-like phospholipase family protein [Syntrophorhabdus aromaticivorans]|uniref:patatin-like phospholipase family protein n=1 Tax=Syntrophorhabdus aromaticivorans TaxID=328301 RepID=UPI000685C3A2|nr:patatin-like phospholipase family protein [Syntrophorhabdus aromaticivorans]
MSARGRSIKRLILLALMGIILSSCQTAQVRTPAGEPRIALVLGGGAAKGFAHVGVIRVLEQEKIPIHMVVGTSVGSLIGGIYASNPDSFQLEWTAFKIDRNDVLDFSIVHSKLGPVQGARLEGFVDQTVKIKKVENTKIPFYPVATDLNTGQTVVLEKGSLSKAIRASSAIPGIFVPVAFDNRMLVDGGVTNNVPCDVARSKGADIIIAVNVGKDIRENNISSLIDVVGQSAAIMMRESSKAKLRYASVVIEPDTGGVGMFDFTRKKMLLEEGMKAARQAVPKIRELMARYSK